MRISDWSSDVCSSDLVSALNEKGKYGFIVDGDANKVEIKNAVEKQYGVNVEKVNTMNVMGKLKTRYTKAGVLAGRRPNYKKAKIGRASCRERVCQYG